MCEEMRASLYHDGKSEISTASSVGIFKHDEALIDEVTPTKLVFLFFAIESSSISFHS